MRAIIVEGGKGPAEAMRLGEIERPAPAPGEILVKVAAAGVNRPDILQREGKYPPPPGAPDTLGLEVAGTVEQLGEGVTQWQPGDRVCALLGGGGYAEYAVVDARHALPVPDRLSLEEAAALPETVFTVFTNVFERGRLAAGETLLVHGGNSGIGVTAIAMARAAGARVVTTVRGAEKAARVAGTGADRVVDVAAENFVDACQDFGGVDVVLDMVGGDYFAGNLAVLRTEGRLVQIATLGGPTVPLDLRIVMMKRLTITASTLRARPPEEKARLAAAIRAQVWPWIERGEVAIPVDRRFPLAEAAAAHRWLEAGNQLGKVVLIP